MKQSNLEPVGSITASNKMNISFRGSLAEDFYSLSEQENKLAENNFIQSILKNLHSEYYTWFYEGMTLVIGKRKDKGSYFPDW